ncbi:hypothetical protein, partial [Virgibacillus pantothenticus]|uniref:hypothetical protein n=1 Tax=Virgibacillus pantothenticus TaxID=1473 RepID=UPI0025AFD6CE
VPFATLLNGRLRLCAKHGDYLGGESPLWGICLAIISKECRHKRRRDLVRLCKRQSRPKSNIKAL